MPELSSKPDSPRARSEGIGHQDLYNLLDRLPAQSAEEITTELLAHSGVRIERIVSTGQATPPHAPYSQPHDEWVLLLTGSAGLKIEMQGDYRLTPGDCLLIPANRPHWVTWTAQGEPTVWLAIHFPRVVGT
jgi:cupin 2 domain-containing protein